MRTDSPLAAKFIGIFLVVSAASVILFAIFRYEVMERLGDGLTNNPFAFKESVSDVEVKAASFELRPEQNDIAFVDISELRTGASTPAGTPISFTLTNRGSSNSFPSVRVVLLNRLRQPVRQVIFSEADYSHPTRFEQHTVELLLTLEPGESSYTAHPFYPTKL